LDSVAAEVTLRNSSAFPLTYKLVALDSPRPNFNNQQAFTLVPVEALVQPGQACKVRHSPFVDGSHRRGRVEYYSPVFPAANTDYN